MSESKIAAALSVQLSTMGLPTAYDNSPFTPTTGVLYLKESVLRLPTKSVGVSGASSDQHDGIYQVLIMAPKDTGKGQGNPTADLVAAKFKKATTLTYQGQKVVCISASVKTGFPLDDRYVVPVDIRYRAFT
jgi:hypothetical protein